jgi:hypothetical protein
MKTAFVFRFSKNLILALVLFLGFNELKAQNPIQPSTYQTVFSKNNFGRTRVSGFVNILNELSLAKSSKVGTFYSIGGEAALLLGQRFYLGAYSLASVAPLDLEKGDNNLDDLKYLQVGGIMGFKFNPNQPLHFNVGTRVGYAGMYWLPWQDFEINRYTQHIDGVQLTPYVNVELNLFSWMQINGGVSYRWTWADEKYGLNPRKDFSHPNVQFGVAFGYFR